MSTRQQAYIRLPLPAGGELDGYLSFLGEPGPDAVLYVHGFGSTRGGIKADALEAACVRRGWPFAAFDFRGHGRSGGSLLELRGSGLLEDLAAVAEGLEGRGIRRLFPVGSSMGGWAAAWFALNRGPVAVPALGLIAPAFRFLQRRWDTLTEAQREEWRRTGRLRIRNQWVDLEIGYGIVEETDRYQPEALAARWQTPLLIYHGMADDTVPVADSLAFVEHAALPDIELRLLKGGDHRLLKYKDFLSDEFCRFFGRWWQSTAPTS
jgi:alpha-beta hydrolase superfamily lysophospholipase